MKIFTLLSIFFTLVLLSCKKEQTEYHFNKASEKNSCSCSDIKFSSINKRFGNYEIEIELKTNSSREEFSYPGLRLLDENSNEISISYSYLLPKGHPLPFSFSIPDSLIGNCKWRAELIQLHSEDSVICSMDYNQCID